MRCLYYNVNTKHKNEKLSLGSVCRDDQGRGAEAFISSCPPPSFWWAFLFHRTWCIRLRCAFLEQEFHFAACYCNPKRAQCPNTFVLLVSPLLRAQRSLSHSGRASDPALICVSSQPLTDRPDLILQPFYSPRIYPQTPGGSEDFLRTHKTTEICAILYCFLWALL